MSETDVHERPESAVSDPRARIRSSAGAGDAIASTSIGEMRFAPPLERDTRAAELTLAGVLVVRLEAVPASARGRLGDVIDEAIERELAARGAASPGVGSTCDRDTSLGDQLFRARRVGARGLCVTLGPLRAAQGPRGALEPEDSATLRFLATATRERPLGLLLDASDARTGAFGDPVPLAALLERPAEKPNDALSAPSAIATPARGVISAPDVSEGASTKPVTFPAPPPRVAVASVVAAKPGHAHVDRPHTEPHPTERQRAGASVATEADAWRSWTLQLVAARGPQPLAAFEKIFAQSYLPLSNAIAGGLDDPRALQAHDEFRRTFERAYSEACPTFAVTGKRPRLVLDVPDVAARTARLHGARSVHLLLVDAMRFDLGCMVRSTLARALDGRASLTDEMVVWSALPSVTTRQLEGLARGLEAMRRPPQEEREPDAVRGRTAEIVRRMKIGSRDLFKLDVVESRLHEAGERALEVLPELAQSVATIIARHAEHLAPRTLLVVFGDHGFAIDPNGAAKQGGASPEEILVPAFTFLVGDVH